MMNERDEFEVIYEDGENTSDDLAVKAMVAIAGGLIAGVVVGFGIAKKKYDKMTVGRIDKKIKKLEKKKEELLKEEEEADKEDPEEDKKENKIKKK